MLEALVFLESAGREDAIASDTEGAVGLTQILAETGQNLLGMQVDVAASRRLTRRIGRAAEQGRNARAAALTAERRRVDERYDPVKALAGTARYLTIAQQELGREDLAFVSYHMGIGNLQGVLVALRRRRRVLRPRLLRLDARQPRRRPAPARVVRRRLLDLSVAAGRGARDHAALPHRPRRSCSACRTLQTAKNSAEEVLHPLDDDAPLRRPGRRCARRTTTARSTAFPNDPAVTGLARDARMGELAKRVGAEPDLYRGLQPQALAMAMYIGAQVRHYSGRQAPLTVTSTVRDEAYQAALVRRNREATRNYSLHTTGWAFDVARTYAHAAPGARLPVRARPAPDPRRDRLGARARRDPRHRRRRQRGPAAAARAARLDAGRVAVRGVGGRARSPPRAPRRPRAPCGRRRPARGRASAPARRGRARAAGRGSSSPTSARSSAGRRRRSGCTGARG